MSGLFAWAVMNDHKPLLSFALDVPAVQERLSKARLNLRSIPLFGEEGGSAAHYAARSEDLTLFNLVYSQSLFNKPDSLGKTCLYIAAEQGNATIMDSILTTYENNLAHAPYLRHVKEDNRGRNPLHAAIEGGHTKCIGLLREKQFDFHSNHAAKLVVRHDQKGIYPLQFAVRSRNQDFLESCLRIISSTTKERQNLTLDPMWISLLNDALDCQLWASIDLIFRAWSHHYRACGTVQDWLTSILAGNNRSEALEKLIVVVYPHERTVVTMVCADFTSERPSVAGALCNDIIAPSDWKDLEDREFPAALHLVLATDSKELFQQLVIYNFWQFEKVFGRHDRNRISNADWFTQTCSVSMADLYIHAYVCMELRLKQDPALASGRPSANGGSLQQDIRSEAFRQDLLTSLDIRVNILAGLGADLTYRFLVYIHTLDESLLDFDPDRPDVVSNRLRDLARHFGGEFTDCRARDVLLWVLACNGLYSNMENLLRAGTVSPHVRCSRGTTPLWQVCMRGSYHCVPLLLDYRADARVRNSHSVEGKIGRFPCPMSALSSLPSELVRTTSHDDLVHIPSSSRREYQRKTLRLLEDAERIGPQVAGHVRGRTQNRHDRKR
ncbi:ankyrin repeat-containing domain protein [Elsinoe ampelina]|uniref:Ankyrin repeat-containing domain protein n=1 Tax=Elsinoe ampelina TaxID=302913 RepID=A0A6A6GHY9_9PEZI|nr:ankyrin repeat-containing domain protein [Elsinoe ampelina]